MINQPEALTVEPLVAKGMLYQLLAGGFAYPSAAWQQAYADGTFARALVEAAAPIRDDALAATVVHFRQRLTAGNVENCGLAEEYTFLFAQQAQVPPYENRYLPSGPFGQPQGLADVGGFYAAFGFQVEGDMPDHLGAELEFLGALCLKEAHARQQGWSEQADICHQARRRFMAEHLALWLSAFVIRLHEKARLPFYPALAKVVEVLVAMDRTELGIAAEGTREARIRPAVPEDDGQCTP